MNDKELLRLAAKAAEIKLCFMPNDMPRNCIGMHESMNIFSVPTWNPLTDDGDALRLAVKLGITDLSMAVGKLILAENTELTGVAVVRRAITRAAAEMGKSK